MSVNTANQGLDRKKKELAKLSASKSDTQKRLSRAVSKEASARAALAKAKTPAQLRTKRRALDAASKAVVSEQKKLAAIEKQIARKQREVATAEKRLSTAQKKADNKDRKVIEKSLRENDQAHDEFSLGLSEQKRTLDGLEERIASLEMLPESISVLFLGCGPEDQARLRLDKEMREIRTALSLSRHRDSVQLEDRWAVRTGDLFQALNEVEPTIVHFSGHGAVDGSFLFENSDGRAKPISPANLASALATVSDTVRMAVFNACFSERQAAEVTQYIDAAIGMRVSISDNAAVVFAASLYSSIGFGLSLEKSFMQAKASLLLECPEEAEIPQLYTAEGIEPKEIYFVVEGE